MNTPDDAKTRDDQMTPGAPPRPATEPAAAKGSSKSGKTQTDPATGAPNRKAPAPLAAD